MPRTKSTKALAKKPAPPQKVVVSWRDPFDHRQMPQGHFTIDAEATQIDSRCVCRAVAKAQGVDASVLLIYFSAGSEPLNPRQKTLLDVEQCGEGTMRQ